ncbi:hypothetical protein VU11_03240 [Desulfobulbus sp. US2]|nr:hypothetical protein [Desulfobulbus sp. US2]
MEKNKKTRISSAGAWWVAVRSGKMLREMSRARKERAYRPNGAVSPLLHQH